MTGRYSKRKRNNESTSYQQRPWAPAPSKSIVLLVASAFRRKHLALGGAPVFSRKHLSDIRARAARTPRSHDRALQDPDAPRLYARRETTPVRTAAAFPT